MITPRIEIKYNTVCNHDISTHREDRVVEDRKISQHRNDDTGSQWWKKYGIEPSADFDFLIGRGD